MAKTLSLSSDEELLRLMLAGDGDAFEALYDRRQGGVYRFALRMSGSAEIAEDVTHDVFIALMRDGHQFDPARGSVTSYLFGIARHCALKRLRRERSFVSISDDVEDGVSAPKGLDERLVADADPFADLTRSETIDLVRQAILALPEHYREVVALCSLGEMSYEQAASVIGCPVGTVRSRLNRAREILVRKLSAVKGPAANSTPNSAMAAR
ncbi:MAG TPA: RNA polymerase sigma factor [Blastocatellia bacterium]|nr:RNA polymerase sigma factor [Blastocatellia bacterium]